MELGAALWHAFDALKAMLKLFGLEDVEDCVEGEVVVVGDVAGVGLGVEEGDCDLHAGLAWENIGNLGQGSGRTKPCRIGSACRRDGGERLRRGDAR